MSKRHFESGFTATGIPREISRAMRGWSKYGGPNHGFFTNTPEWYCQACKELQTEGLPSYRIRIDEGEDFVKICSVCLHTTIIKKFSNVMELIDFIGRINPDF